MSTSSSRSGDARFGIRVKKGAAAVAAFVISVTSLVVGAVPAAAAPGVTDLSITKVANGGSALLGTAVEFTVTVTNAGPGDTTGVVVTDILPSEFTFMSASATTGSYDSATGIWSVGSMPNGSTRTLNLTAEAASVAFVTNTATISASNQPDPNSGNNSASAAVNIVTVPPAVCDTNDIIGISGDTIYSVNTQTGVATAEFRTSFNTGDRNALASNSDLGLVYWGSGSVVYWWNPIDDTEGVLVDLTGQINGTLESAGATYNGGYYYFSTEISGNANGIYRIAIDPTNGTAVIPGSLAQLAPNQPEDGLEAALGRDLRPDYGDLTVLTVNGQPVMFGSVADGYSSPLVGYWWSYNINSGVFTYITRETSPSYVQLGTDLDGHTWGTTTTGALYQVNQATGQMTYTGHSTGINFYDLSGSFCVPPELADIDLSKTLIGNADEDGSSTVTTGDTLTYQFAATNTGNVALTGVTISDPLPGMSGLSCSEPMPAGLSSGDTLTCTATYTVTAGDEQRGHITNTASVVGTAPSGATVTDTATEIVTVAQPEVTVTKTSDATGPVVAGQLLTYTVTVDNTGVFPIDNISVVDPLPAATSYVDESTLVSGWTGGTTAGSWSQLVDQDLTISQNCSSPTRVTFSIPDATDISDVNLGFTASHADRGQLRATLTSPAGTEVVLASGNSGDRDDNYDVLFDGDSTGPLDDNSADSVSPADYERSVGVAALESLAGQPGAGTWTLNVCDTNPFFTIGTFHQATLFIEGTGTTTSPLVEDNIPGGSEADLVNGVPPVLVDAADGFDLPAGESMTITYQVKVDDTFDGSVADILNEATVFSDTLPATTGYVTDPIDFQPELQVVKAGPAGPVAVGETVTYTYTVTHTAASDGSPVDVVISDDVVDLSGATLSGDTDGNGLLDGNETWVYTIDHTVPLDTADPLVNVATVTGTDGNGDPITDATDSHSVDVDFRPALTVTKVGGPAPAGVGDTVTYTYTVAHAPTSDMSPVAGVTVVDSRGLTLSGPTGDTNGNGLLDGDETWIYTATETVTAATPDPLTNDVTVDGTDSDGDPIPQATDTETIDVDWAPLLQVDKTGPATATIGETVTYTFAVSHAPGSDGSPVTVGAVSDDVAGAATYVSGDDGDGFLEAAETWVYQAGYTVTGTDPDPLVNTVTVTGTDLDGDSVPAATDTHSTDIDHLPVLVINKTGPASALVGDTVTYGFTVSHDSTSDGSPVANVTVTDDVAGAATYVSGDDGDGLLETGETWVFTADYTIQATDPDPLVNTATVTGDDTDGDPTSDTDTHSTDVIQRASIGDFVWNDLNGDGTPDPGEPGLDGVTVNLLDGTGAVAATTVTTGGGAYSFTYLPPGDYTVDVDEATLPFSNPVLTSGNEPDAVTLGEGEDNTDADFGYYQPVTLGDLVWDDLNGDGIQDSGEPGIVGATVNVYDAGDLATPVATATTAGNGSWSVTLAPGNYVVEFALPGAYEFSPADVGSDATDSDADPATGQTAPITVISGDADTTIDAGAYVPVTIGDFVWNDLDGDGVQDPGEPGIGGVTVTVFDGVGTEIGSAVTAADGSYSIVVPPGDYDAVVDTATLPAGYVPTTPTTFATGPLQSGETFTTADFGAILPTYPISGTVWNDENADTVIDAVEPPLAGVTVELRDDTGTVVATATTRLDGSYSFPPVPSGDYTVSVDETTVPAGMSSTTGNNPQAITVADAAVADVDFGYAYPGMVTIAKGPANQQVVGGGTATFTITVTNAGPQDLTGVVVTDPGAPGCDNTIGALAAGASTTYTCTLAGVTADFTNTATVTADDEVGNTVTDSDSANVDVIGPAITIAKTPDNQMVLAGDDATFAITVTNSGDVALTDVSVTDALVPDCDATFAALAAGAVQTYTCSVAGVTTDFTNTATVAGDDPLGDPITDNDTADVDVINPGLDIQKTPDTQTVVTGDDATFTITVTNTGDVPLTDVTISDVLAPDCGATFATLAAGTVETYTCTVVGVTADFTNIASVSGDDPLGNRVSDSDVADVDVINPAIDIQKTPHTQQTHAGDTVTFDITVTNTGDVDLTDVAVADAVAPVCDATIGSLASGATTSYSCTMTAGAADFTNTADVTGDDPLGNPVTDSDTADVDVINPAITISKTPDTQQTLPGGTVTFDITVTNTGDVDLSNVAVTDLMTPTCNASLATLAAGASATYNCSTDAGALDFTNIALVSGDDPLGNRVSDSDVADVDVINPAIDIQKTPHTQQTHAGDTVTFDIRVTNTGDVDLTDVAVSDAVAPDCDATIGALAAGGSSSYSCTMTAGADDFTNTANVTGDDPLGNPVTDSDTADVDVINPGIDLQKTPDVQQAHDGDTVTFDITVTNTGDVDLTDVTVTDAVAPDCDAAIGTLAAGASTSYSCTMTAGAADFTNTAVVTGDDPLGSPVTDSDTADVDVINPGIDIQKTPDVQQAHDGDTVTFDITVTNTGDVNLTDVAVTDAVVPDCDATLGSLSAGASASYSCTMTAGADDFTNNATVTADDPLGTPVTDSDTADVDVINPGITIDKTPDLQTILAGDAATFTITVTNTGDVDLTDVTVTDALAADCDAAFATLAVGAAESYGCTVAGVTADFTNTADVTGDDPLGSPVSDGDTADVDVIGPAITIQKTPDLQQVVAGGDATFTITVTNTGDVDLTDVTVTDALAADCDAAFATLAVGAAESYGCTVAGITADFTNTAAVTSDDPLGNAVTDTDTADVDVINPAIAIQKTPDTQQALAGDTVTFDIAVTNTGDVDLTDVTVTDVLAADCDATFATLAVGAGATYSCTMTAGASDFTNAAVVTGDDPLGNLVTDSDTADVDIINPAIDIQKTPDTQQALSGDTVTFDITVTNTGDVDLSNVTVVDVVAPDCDATVGGLAAGASTTYSCTMTAGSTDFTNTASVTGDDPIGNPVTDSDSADVDVINPAITVVKTPNLQQALAGDTVTFDITVTNAGDVDLDGVAVTDAVAPDCDATIGSLAAGTSTTYSCTMTAGAVDFTNTAVVTGDDPLANPVTDSDTADVDIINPAIDIQKTPDTQQALAGDTVTFDINVANTGDVDLTDVAVADVLAPDCDANVGSLAAGSSTSYSCTMTAGANDFTNTATVTGNDPLANPVTDSDTADVDVIGPAITIDKTPDLQTILGGDDATFTIIVANTGDVPLDNVTVTDALAPGCDATIGTLGAGVSTDYSCTLTGVTADFTNTASATGDDPLGNAVADSDTADVDVIGPAITINKTPDLQTVAAGGTVTFDITVTNTGDVSLSNVAVTDALASDCDTTIGTLAAGATTTYSCTMTAGTNDFTNTAVVTADDPLGNPVTDSDNADVTVINPAVTIDKTPDSQQIVAGETATFDITVTNTGDVDLTDVTVSDPLAPNCNGSFASLATGASETYSCTMTTGGTDFTNTATVTGNDPLANPVTDSDTAAVDVIDPGIDIQKTPDLQQAVAGSTVTFDITVTNNGDVDLANVAVSDALAPDCDNVIGTLAAGASTGYSCTMTAGSDDFTNTALVTGDDPLGAPVTDSDTADVDVVSPTIDIAKNPPSQTILGGTTATFDITVTNSGDVSLDNVVVTDAQAPNCDATYPSLAAGESVTYSCTLGNVTADLTNVAVVVAEHPATPTPVTDSDVADVEVIAPEISITKTPATQTVLTGSDVTFTITVTNSGDADLSNVVVTDALAPACDATFAALPIGATEAYDCTVPAVTADFTNVADVTAGDPSGGTVTDSDSAAVDVIDPAITVAKTPDTQTVLAGDDATFTITVTNTGDVDLTDIAVTDAQAPGCDGTIGNLAPGETASYDCTVVGVTTGFTNVADVTATDPLGNPVGDSDDAVVIVSAPAIEMVKTADTPVIVSGADATFTITVTNVGTDPLTDVTVTDALAPDCDAAIGDLASGEATTYSCTMPALNADVTNTASVVGTHPLGGTVTDEDTADVNVIAPAITITKTADNTPVLAGQDATFTITVTNTGDVDLTGVQVTDPAAPDCDATIGDLTVGANTSYTCTIPAVTADFTNTASVVGDDSLGNTVSDSDDAAVDVVNPAITIDKTPDSQFVTSGSDATFTITVTNTGDVDLTDVAVTDALVPGCDATLGDLASGASISYSCDATGVGAGFTNTASVVGTHPAGGTVTDEDTADVGVISPAITLAKDPALQQLLAGEDASFTITVSNTGDSPLTDVTISDPQAPGCDAVVPNLGIGASQTVNCTVADVTADFTNTASVVATHPAGGTVTASDSADVVVLVPQIDIQKTPDTQLAAPGSDVTFTITVTNAGVVPLIDVAVTDTLAPACNTTIATLGVGETTSYDCTVTGVTADFTNVADVTATDTAGNPAADSDSADVDVVAPAISIAKTPDLQSVGLNGTPMFTISVTNTGDIDLTDVAVADTLAPACDATVATLPVGATETYACDGTATAADFTNTASVTADSAVGPVTDSDTADVTVLVPGIDIQKTPDTQLVGPGGTATFTITVTNAGATPLNNITVSDPLAPACDATIAALAIGESTSYDCDVTGVAADFTNTASVTAEDPLGNPVADSDTADVDFVDPAITVSKTPDLQTLLAGEDASFTVTVTNSGDTDLSNVVVSDPLAPGCDATFASLTIGAGETVTCTVTGVPASFTNVATATADTPIGTQVSDSDDAQVVVVTPGVEIQKTPDTQQIHSGDDVTFTITVTNTGDQDLVDLAVTDAQTPACDATIATLAVGDSTSYDCTATAVTADFTNIASVAGTDVLGNPVSDSDGALVDVIAPALDVQKTPDNQAVVVSGTATFTITVTNTGDVDLTGVQVTDPLAPDCDTTIGDLAVGALSSFTCSLTGVTADFTNTASAGGTDPIGSIVTASDTADVTVVEPGIEIQKTPDLQQARTGDTVDFTITVTNTGGVALSNVTVTDASAPACDSVVGDLAVSETTSYTCSMTAGAADFTNTADVTGDDPIGNPVTDSDSADVDVIAPAISIQKSPDGQTVVAGDAATFTIEVANTGDVDLTGVTVTDALVPACDSTVGDLAAGASTSYTCTVSDVTAGFTNTADVSGTDPIGLEVTDSDTADVTVLVPGIDIQKTPDIQTVVEGDDATFTIIVTNTGQTDLTGVAVTDPLVPACDNAIGDLPVGSPPVSYTCSVTAIDDFTNTATAAATDPLGNALSDEDNADVMALARGNLSGTIAHDVAGDGVIDPSDIGLDGIPVAATWAGLDGVFGTTDDEVLNTTTNGNGDYGFDLVPPGLYEITVDTGALPAGVDFPTVDPDGTLDSATTLTLPPGSTVDTIDFAYTATGSIGDQVFLDLDGNSVQDPGEPGIGGVDVTVTWFGPDGVIGGGDDLIFTTTTTPDGRYEVDGLPAGDFSVVIGNVPAGLTGATSQMVTLVAAEARDDADFPLAGSGSIGDQVFEDVDRNGVFGAGEPGVAGVTVNVTWAGGDGVIGTADDIVFTTVTDPDGRYLVDGLPAGGYRVEMDDATIPADLGTAPPVTLTLGAGETDLDVDFPLVGNRPPVAVDDSAVTDQDTPVVISVLGNDSDPDGHAFAVDSTTPPLNGTVVVNPDGTITYTPNSGFVGTDTFTYTICEVGGPVGGVPATGLCDTATVTVTVNKVNQPPGPEASFQSVVVGDPLSPIPVSDPDGGPVTVTYVSGELPPGITLNPDGTFSGVTEEIGTYQIVVQVCDDDVPQICILHTHTIAVTPVTLPGPEDPPGGDEPPPDTLPFTGGNFGDLFIAALMMLSAGAGMVLYSRKRREM